MKRDEVQTSPPSVSELMIGGKGGLDPATGVDARRQFRNTLGHFATGVTIVTARSETSGHIGMTVSSFNSLSLDPPLILWSIANTSTCFREFQLGSPFAVNILSAEQGPLALQCSRTGGAKFEGISLHSGLDGVPLIDGCVAYFECLTEARYPGGDHDIIVGRVRRLFEIGRSPLLFHTGTLKGVGETMR